MQRFAVTAELLLMFVGMRPLSQVKAHAIAAIEKYAGGIENDPAVSSCQRAYLHRIQTLCRYPDQAWPCFRGSRLTDGVIHHIYDVVGIAAQACSTSATDADFSLGDVYKDVCCFTPDCLEKCYGVIPDLDNDLFMRANNLPHAPEAQPARLYERKRSTAVVTAPSMHYAAAPIYAEDGDVLGRLAQRATIEDLTASRLGQDTAVMDSGEFAEAIREQLEAELFVKLLQAARISQRSRTPQPGIN